jgi:thiol-disulfide isomerase/thioredoxin
LAVVLICISSGADGQEAAKTDGSALDALKLEYDEAMKAWQSRFTGDVTTPSAQLIARWDLWPGWLYIPQVVKLGTENPETPYSFDALKWFVELSCAVGSFDREIYSFDEQAMAALRTQYLAHPRIGELLKDCSRYATPGREALLRACAEKGATRDVRGLACLYLAEYLRNKERIASHVAKPEELLVNEAFQKHVNERQSPEWLAFIRSTDSQRTLAEADVVDRRVLDEFGDVQAPFELPFVLGKPTLAFWAGFRRAQTEAPSLGKPAPELVSKDLDGKERKLSDYKGKVVVLHFWATWCPPCVEKFPQLKELATKHSDQPFRVLGVNYDRDRKAAVKYVEVNHIDWPSWWAIAMGETMGSWFVTGTSPSILVLDETGVLRYHNVEGAALDKAVESLLRERAEMLPDKN